VSFWNQGAGVGCASTSVPDAATYDTDIRHTIDALQTATGHRPGYIEAWNEPNLNGGPSEATAASFFAKAYYACGNGTSCTVIAGDFVDSRDGNGTQAQQWCDDTYASAAAYEQNYINALGTLGLRPGEWGFHPYNSGRCNTTAPVTTLEAKLSAARITHAFWFTEVGAYKCQTSTGAYQDDSAQAADATWMVRNLLTLPGVAHAFYYGLANYGPTPIGTPNACQLHDQQDSVLYSGDPNDGKYHARPAATAIFGPSNLTTSTSAASAISRGGATLRGTVNPGGISDAQYYFQYGTTTGYGTQTGAIGVGPGSANVTAASTVDGLAPATVYHFRVIARNADGTIKTGADQTFKTLETPYLLNVTSNNIGYIQSQPWTSTGWGAFINWPSDLTTATGGDGTTWALAKDDPDQDNQGTAYFQTTPFTPTWYPIAPLLAQMAITTPVGGGAMVTGVSAQDGVLYQMDSPFTASGWHAIAPATDRVAATAPAGGGTQIVQRDVRAPHVAYFQDSPYTAEGWHAIANSVDEIALTSPSTGGTVVAITDENTHKAWFQNSPYTSTDWHALADNAKHIYLTRAGNGQARVGLITTDGNAYVQTYPFSSDGWQRISPDGWNVRKLAMSGDSLAMIHDSNGNPVASYTQEPFPSTFTASDWHDVANSATDIGFSQRGF
jgi:hypothetical protein